MSRIAIFGQISEINDHLYLSGSGVLRPDLKKEIERLRQKGVQCIINVTVEEPTYYNDKVDCVKIRIEDSPYARLDHYFDIAADKIRATKDRGGKTLVHCVAGVSRSATLCIVYLMKYEHMTLKQAYHFVKAARPIIRPNLGFWKQMVDYERKLRGENTVAMIRAENFPLSFPDVYSNELRKHMMSNPGPAHNDPYIVQKSKSSPTSSVGSKATIIPVQILGSKRDRYRGPQWSSSSNTSNSSVGSSNDSRSDSGFMRALNGASSTLPWRAIAISPFLSPSPSRRVASFGGRTSPRYYVGGKSDSGEGSLIGKIYGPGLFSAI